ncbi:MAG: aldehyde dehydrogenase family protein, partial [Thermales bacterium]|nr:aldehyde dehydrogenase family protein [Thermales bacterium]
DVVVEFTKLFSQEVAKEIIGDPTKKETTMGPLATIGQLLEVERQVSESINMGAKVEMGGKRVQNTQGFFL